MPKRKSRYVRGLLLITAMAMLLVTGCGSQYPVLDPAGPAGREELHLIVLSAILVGIVIVPVLGLLVYIVWRYRDKPGNKAPYEPKWSDSRVLEIIWWGIPVLIVGILGAVTAKTTFALVQPPTTAVTPVTVQVTSLDWKWLFQYPGQQVATVNYCVIPTGVPIQFELTADAPMNSFWVPQLGGQEYTMPGMAMRLWLEADQAGSYYGHGANFTGTGFAQMAFRVIAKPSAAFDAWVRQVKSGSPALTKTGYNRLVRPGVMSTASYSSYPPGSFNDTVWADGGRYMPGMLAQTGSAGMPGMSGAPHPVKRSRAALRGASPSR